MLLLPLCFRLGTGKGLFAFGGLAVVGLLALSLVGELGLRAAGLPGLAARPDVYRAALRGASSIGAPSEVARAAELIGWIRSHVRLHFAVAGTGTAAAALVSAMAAWRFHERRDLR